MYVRLYGTGEDLSLPFFCGLVDLLHMHTLDQETKFTCVIVPIAAVIDQILTRLCFRLSVSSFSSIFKLKASKCFSEHFQPLIAYDLYIYVLPKMEVILYQ